MCAPGPVPLDRPAGTAARVEHLEQLVEQLLHDRPPVAAAAPVTAVPRQAGPSLVGPRPVAERRQHDRRRSTVLDLLGPREREVLALVSQGWSNAGVARELHLSERTVEATASTVFRKMGLTASPATNRRVLAVLAYLGCEATVPPA